MNELLHLSYIYISHCHNFVGPMKLDLELGKVHRDLVRLYI